MASPVGEGGVPSLAEGGTGERTTGVGGLAVPLGVYVDTMRDADLRFDEERDRRYTEVNIEREKALKIKETADLAALQLAREIQTYKDEQANDLRNEISAERGLYATKTDLANAIDKLEVAIKPLTDFVTSSAGESAARGRFEVKHGNWTIWAAGAAVTLVIAVLVVASNVLTGA